MSVTHSHKKPSLCRAVRNVIFPANIQDIETYDREQVCRGE
jgi:hypothetical protein